MAPTQTPLPGPVSQPPYLSVVDDRRPVQKTHRSIGQAKNAVGLELGYHGVRGGRIYRWEDDRWELVFDIAPGTHPDELPWHVDEARARAKAELEAASRTRARGIEDLATLIACHDPAREDMSTYLYDAGVRAPKVAR